MQTKRSVRGQESWYRGQSGGQESWYRGQSGVKRVAIDSGNSLAQGLEHW